MSLYKNTRIIKINSAKYNLEKQYQKTKEYS